MDEKKVSSKGTNLEKLKRVFEAEKNNSDGSMNWWRPKAGINTVRILPATDPEDIFFFPTARHKIDEDYFYCLHYDKDSDTGRGKKCPVCETRKRLFRSGDPTLIKIAKDIKAKKQFLMNLVDRDPAGDPAKVFIFAAGVKINDKICSSMIDDNIDITNIDDGYDFIVKKEEGPKTENGTFPSYDNSKAKRQSSPLHEDTEVVRKILEARNDLKSVPRFDTPEVLQNAIDSYIKNLTEGSSKNEKFYDEDAPAEETAPSQKAKTNISDFKKKLQDSLKADDDDDGSEDEDSFPG